MKSIKFIVSVLICQSAGIIGSLFTTPAISAWYVYLEKPNFSPPSWLFGPVWITLYTMMGISLYLIWQKKEDVKGAWSAIIFFVVHLLINSLWSIVFFGQKSVGGALVVIVILWLMIVTLIFVFYRINKIAGYLLAPYLLWVSFAAVLNYSIWRLN